MTQEELAAQREKAQAERRPFRIDSPWRDVTDEQGDKPFVIRLKAPREGETVIDDQVQGRVTVQNAELDDFILLRSDGTPTYMLAVVVDDHDMGVTHVIRGDDHLNNAFRQLAIIRAMGWPEPIYAHVPLIHGPDGAKLSASATARSASTPIATSSACCPRRSSIICCGSAGAMATTRSSAASRRSNGSTSTMSASRRRASTSRSSRTSTAITSARPTTSGWPSWSRRGSASRTTQTGAAGHAPCPSSRRARIRSIELAEGARFLFAERPLDIDEAAAALLTAEARALLAARARDSSPHLRTGTRRR